MSNAHALLSASSASRWLNCPGSVALCKDLPDEGSIFAFEGTAAHTLASWCLELDKSPWDYEGEMIRIINGKYMSPSDVADFLKDKNNKIKTDNSYEVDQKMIEYIEEYIQVVNDFTPAGASRYIEQRVDFSSHIGVRNSFGTSDVIIIHNEEITILDLKFGVGVQVDAEENPQLMLYALGALNRYGLIHDFKRVRMVIHQPRIQHLSEWDCSVDELLEFAATAKSAAQWANLLIKGTDEVALADLNPSEKACRWCKAKSTCPALAAQVTNLIADDFVNLDDESSTMLQMQNAVEILPAQTIDRLAVLMKGAPLVEIWLKGVREAVYNHLARGDKVKGFKLVRGREGARKWKDENLVVSVLDKYKVSHDDIFEKFIISPTQAEKKLKKKYPEAWRLVQENHISRSDGKLSVAPEDDKREPVSVEAITFEDLENLTGEE